MLLFPIICFFLVFCCCCWLSFLPIIATKETKLGRDQDELGLANGTFAAAPQSPSIKWTDEEKAPTAAADELLQNTQLFRTANAKRFRNAMSSNKDRMTQDEATRLQNMAKEVEEKLGLAPAGPNGKQQWPMPFGISTKRGDLSPPAFDSPALLNRFIGIGDNAGGLQRIRPPNALVTSLLRQQRELAIQPNIIRPIIGGSTLIAQQQQQQQQFERDQQQQQRLVQQQQLQTQLLQQLAAIQQQRQQLQEQKQKQRLSSNQRQSATIVAGRNERRGASRTSSTSFRANTEKFVPSGFFVPANPLQPSPSFPPLAFPGKSVPTSVSGIRLGGPSSATVPIFGGVQPDSRFGVQPPPILPTFRPISPVDSAADLSALLQKLSRNIPTNPISSSATIMEPPIATVLPNPNGVAQVAVPKPQQERPLVVKFVTAAAGNNEQQQSQNPSSNNNAIALQQIVLQEQQRIVELLEREQYREQLVQNNRKELQSVQEKQQRILELLDAAEREKQRQQQIAQFAARISHQNRRTMPKATTTATTTTTTTTAATTKTPTTTQSSTQQQSLADANLLRGLLQAFSGLITSQQQTGTASASVLLPASSSISANVPGQQQLQLPNIGGANGQFVVSQPQQQQQVQAVQQQQQPQQLPSSAVQYIAVYDTPRMAQQQQFNAANLPVAGMGSDGTVSAAQAQQVGAAPQLQQQIVGSLFPFAQPQQQQQQVGAVVQTGTQQLQQQQQQQVGAVPVLGWLPTADDNAFSNGQLWQQLQQQNINNDNNGNGQQPLLQQLVNNGNSNFVQRTQRRRQDVQQANGARKEEEKVGEAMEEDEGEAGEEEEEEGRRGRGLEEE